MNRTTVRPTRGSILAMSLAMAFFVASRTAGAGWLSVMVAVLCGLVAYAGFDSWRSVRRVSVDIHGPSDTVVGRRFDVTVAATAPASGVVVSVGHGPEEVWAAGPMSGQVQLTAGARGVLEHLPVTIRSDGALGLVRAHRRCSVLLPVPMDVAPAPTPVQLPAAALLAGQGETAVGGRHSDGETVRSVREYQPGDPLRMINWAVTARRDTLVVKELEAPQSPTLVVAVDLRGDPDIAERHASLAAGYVQVGLRSGLPVVLHTHDSSGPHAGGVGSMLEAGRRLARATPGPLPTRHDAGAWQTVIHLGPRGA